ncbi:hypothetical protein QVD17_38864 [Tagetes erecta]|uniref:RING-type E3 ubiquitin transferase n=1 Tax=Tagetes erecta TaxID=13708 RepID=A0AAD8N9Q7_TARER|nr:hypothetical protein QVD17_38864 [Tagetes erecta]
MINKFDDNSRRILKFPAVLPSQDVNPATLLRSLIVLSDSITRYQHEFECFVTQRKNARKVIRHVMILSSLFTEIIDQDVDVSGLPDSTMLCFAELHFTFQKVQYLLEDCTRTGARVWMLMKTRLVATQFSSLVRAIANVLDVLPLNLFQTSLDVNELVELVTIQARKMTIEVDPNDEHAMKRVMLILNQFENRFEPDPILIKRALRYLRIDSWSQCHDEIMFLNEEISLALLDDCDKDLCLLNSLAGFMKYCRGVLLENCFIRGNECCSNVKPRPETFRFSNVEDFRCPISLELMTDPVTVSTGQTYDRVSIQKWLKSGNVTCPKTGETLAKTELIPNLNLRKVIQQYCVQNGVSISRFQKPNRDISSTILPGSLVYAEAIKFLSEHLVRKLRNGTETQKDRAVYEIRLLTKSNVYNRLTLIESGAVPHLLTLITSSSVSISTQENAIACLLKLSKHESGKNTIINHGGLNMIINVLNNNGSKQECKQIAAAIIFYLSSVETNHNLNQIPKAIPEKPELVTDSLAVLSTLAESFDGSKIILNELPLIINVLQTSHLRAAKEYCVSILLALCNNLGNEVIACLASHPNLFALLYTLSTTGGLQASKKARTLIRVMRLFRESNGSSLMDNWDSSRIAAVRSC